MKLHTLKTWSDSFWSIHFGSKRFEYRKDDRNFEVGDLLELIPWDHEKNRRLLMGNGSEESAILAQVTHVLRGDDAPSEFGLPPGYCVMSIEVVDVAPRKRP